MPPPPEYEFPMKWAWKGVLWPESSSMREWSSAAAGAAAGATGMPGTSLQAHL